MSFFLNVLEIGVSCHNLYSFVVYLYVNGIFFIVDQLARLGKRELICLLLCLPVIMRFLFGKVSSSSGCLGWATLFYCNTP